MKNSKKATSIAEAMVIMLVVIVGVVGMFKVYISSQRLSDSTSNKIQAIQIAREGIEAVKNIRNTNLVLYGADSENCWNTATYDSACVGNTTVALDIRDIANRGHTVYKNSDNRWVLFRTGNLGSDFSNNTYRTRFKVMVDGDGFYTQTGSFSDTKPLFTREIQVEYIDTNGGATNSNDEKMQVTSLVQWTDSNGDKPHKVELTTLISNWEK